MAEPESEPDPEPGPHLELFMEYVAETGEPRVSHLRRSRLIAAPRGFEDAKDEAAQHASDDNYGDGDYHVRDATGRRIAGIVVRAGFAVLTHETPVE